MGVHRDWLIPNTGCGLARDSPRLLTPPPHPTLSFGLSDPLNRISHASCSPEASISLVAKSFVA